jgi:hypothetical protein
MFKSNALRLFVLAVSLCTLAGLAAAATLNVITDDTPAAIIYSDPQANPIIHLSASVDHTIVATSTPLCPYEVHLDGQWQGSMVASDGKVYFGTSSHAPHTSALFMQYNPSTGLVHELGVVNTIVGEDPNYYRPQGKLHSAITEYNGYLYFATYYGYEGNNTGGYPGGHIVRYKLGSFETGTPVFKDMGRPGGGGTIYTATTVDTLNGMVYTNVDGSIYSSSANAPDTSSFTWAGRGSVNASSCFYHFTDSQSNLWTTAFYTNGVLGEVPLGSNIILNANCLPPCRRADTCAVDSGWQYQAWNWGARIDADHWAFSMLYDCFLWTFDANAARHGQFGIGQAFKKVARIGVGGLDCCLTGNTVYWLASARQWYSYCTFYGPNNPDTSYYNYFSDCKAKDLHLMSLNLNDPRLSAPGYDPNVTDPNLVTDWGRIIDQNGRTPYRCEGMSSDGARVYLTGDWRNLPTDPNNWHTLKALYLDIDGGYQQIWRGQFFAVITVGTGGNQAPTVYAGTNQFITSPANTVLLAGMVSDDGLPNPPAATTQSWSKVSGPGTVVFANANAVNTTATFSTFGTYVLSLTASDSALSSSSNVQIFIAAGNLAPVVNAGVDQSITLPATATLTGAVSDDGLPNPPGATTVTWSVVSGPGSVTFANANQASTTATFSTIGTYVLRLTANDSALVSTSNVTITVNPAGNRAPIVSVTNPSSISAPTRTVSLTGGVSDDGQPSPPSITCAWSKVSGPGSASFANPAAASTTVTLACAGTYVLRLTASDGQLSGHYDATITLDGSGYLDADFNGDGCVDGVDFLIWQAHYPTAAGATKAMGDTNGDGKVDGVDFLAWQNEYAVWQ